MAPKPKKKDTARKGQRPISTFLPFIKGKAKAREAAQPKPVTPELNDPLPARKKPRLEPGPTATEERPAVEVLELSSQEDSKTPQRAALTSPSEPDKISRPQKRGDGHIPERQERRHQRFQNKLMLGGGGRRGVSAEGIVPQKFTPLETQVALLLSVSSENALGVSDWKRQPCSSK